MQKGTRTAPFLLSAALLTAPGAAVANPAAGSYAGANKLHHPSGVSFKVHDRRLFRFDAGHLRFGCRNHRRRLRNPPGFDRGLKIRPDGSFAGRLTQGSRRLSYRARLRGRLDEDAGRAHGSVRYHLVLGNGDRCRSKPRRIEWSARNRDLLFASGFQKPVAVLPPQAPFGSWRFPITGADSGFAWQSDLPGRGPHAFFPVVPASEPVDDYAATRIERVAGPHGAPTRALYQEVTRDAKFRPHARVRNQFPLHRPGRRGSVAYWIKLQRNLLQLMPPHERSWRYLMELRGTRRRGSDFRIALGLNRHGTLPIRWRVVGARLVPRYHVNWRSVRSRPRVPIGKWFRLKVSWLIDRSDGRFRVSVDGIPIADHKGRTRRNRPVDSIQIFKVYTSANSLAYGPAFQWIDNVELRR